MWIIGGVLIYLAIKKDMEPTLLLPMGFGAILVNLPLSGAVTQIYDGIKEIGVIDVLFESGIANELFPLLLFIGIGAMIDFEPLLSNPKLMIFGAAAQFGIFFTFSLAALLGFDIKDAGHKIHALASLFYFKTNRFKVQRFLEAVILAHNSSSFSHTIHTAQIMESM